MNHVSSIVKTFFEDFEQANNAFEPDLLEPLFSDPVVGADPNGNIQVLKRADFLAGTAERKAYLQTLGFQFVKTDPLEEIPLGHHYVMVRTHGTMRLETIPGQPVDLIHDSIYVLFIKDDSPRMVFTLSHEHPTKMMRDQGFIPEGSYPQNE